jgi:hypothetical protein
MMYLPAVVEEKPGQYTRYADGSVAYADSESVMLAGWIEFEDPSMQAAWESLPLSWRAEVTNWNHERRSLWLRAILKDGS